MGLDARGAARPFAAAASFEEPIGALRERLAKALGEVALPRSVRIWHTGLARLLADDEKRRAKQAASRHPSVLDDPLCDTQFERRRLRLLNALFLAVPTRAASAWNNEQHLRRAAQNRSAVRHILARELEIVEDQRRLIASGSPPMSIPQ